MNAPLPLPCTSSLISRNSSPWSSAGSIRWLDPTKKGPLSRTPSRQYGRVPGSGNFGSSSMLVHPSGPLRPVSHTPVHLDMGVHQSVGLADKNLSAHYQLEVALELDEAHVWLRLPHDFLLRLAPLSMASGLFGAGQLSRPP